MSGGDPTPSKPILAEAMIRPLNERVPIPSPTIQQLADRLEGEARRLAVLKGAAVDIDLNRLWRRLATWSATVKHIAWSGPASHDVALRAFEEHPDHARAGEDAILQFEALADIIGFVAVGDMVLAAMASTFLGRWGVPFADDNPWPGFLAAIDERAAADDEHLVAPARELDLDFARGPSSDRCAPSSCSRRDPQLGLR
jgi:hypothetical protein